MLLVSWNVAGRVRRLREQAQRVLELGADIVCLQEVSPTTLPRWSEHLAVAGYVGLAHSEFAAAEGRSRRLAVLTASRSPVHRIVVADLPWPERVLAVRLHEGTELVNVHSPTSTKPDLVKVRTHEAIYRHLTRRANAGQAQILCGDLNTPRKELADGGVWTFARDRYGRLRADRGERWDRAELSLIRGLESCGFHDALLCKRGEFSWEWPRWGGGYRLDHLLLRECTGVCECYYEHQWRKEGLSDHSALIGNLEIRPELLRG
jgi:exonuclease III